MPRLAALIPILFAGCISQPPAVKESSDVGDDGPGLEDVGPPGDTAMTSDDSGGATDQGRDASDGGPMVPDSGEPDLDAESTDAGSGDAGVDAAEPRYRVPITIPAGTVDQRVESFPLLVDFQIPALPDGQATTDMLSFVDDQGAALPFDVEFHDPTNGDLRAWVLVGALRPADPSVFYLYFEGASTDPADVWAAYNAVWHFESPDPMDRFVDVSGTGNDFTPVGGPTAIEGAIGNAVAFDGQGSHFTASGNASLEPQRFTISMWAWIPTSTAAYTLLTKPVGTSGAESYQIGAEPQGIWLELAFAGNYYQRYWFEYPTDQWFHIAYTFDGTTLAWRIDGVRGDFAPAATGDVTYDSSDLLIGADADNGVADDFLEGRLDEVRIAPVAFSDTRLDAERRNQQNPSDFFTVGSLEPVP